MALFKIFRGTSEELESIAEKKVDGQVYFTTDTGNLYIDVQKNLEREVERIQINAKAATEILSTAEEGVQKSAKYEDLFAKAYPATLTAEKWDGTDSFTQKVDLPTLTCGEAGNVPPIITLTGQTSIDDYNKIESADAQPGDGITFSCNEKPSGDIEIIVIDLA